MSACKCPCCGWWVRGLVRWRDRGWELHCWICAAWVSWGK